MSTLGPAPDRPTTSPSGDGDPTGRFNPDFLTDLFRNPLDPSYAAAAQARRVNGPLSTKRRRFRRAIALLALVIIGAVFATAYRHVVTSEPQREQARAGLIKQIDQRSEIITGLQAQADGLERDIDQLREIALSSTELARIRELEAATGVRAVTGDGLMVRLSHAQNAQLGDDGFIVDYDLQLITNELWKLGAEAIAINGERLTTTSAIRHTSAGMHIGNVPVPSPYEISAIGPEDLAERFANTDAARYYREKLQVSYRIGFSVSRATDLELPAAKLRELQVAGPLTESGRSGDPSGGDE